MEIRTLPVGQLDTNCYIVWEADGQAVVIDPGAQAGRILDEADAAGVRVRAVLLTHVHFDHILAAREIMNATGAELLVPAGDEPALTSPARSLLAMFLPGCRYDLQADRLLADGDTVTAEDVVYSIERCADDSEGTPLIPALSAISSIQADDTTLTITLDQPDSEFLSYLTLAILPEDYTDQATAPVGTGPFKFVSRTAQDSIVLERFDGYWGTPAQLDKVTFRIIENADSLVMSLQSGAIDMFAHLTSTQAAQLGDDFQVLEGTMNLVQALYLNNAAEPFNNEKVRQALCYAVDKQQIIDVAFDGYGSPIGSSMYPAFQKYFVEDLTDYYPYDPERARELLAEAGYPDGFSMTITVPSNYQPHIDTATVLVEQLKAVGITAEIQPVEWGAWLSEVYGNRQFQSTVVGVDASNMTARALLERFTSAADDNFINYQNTDYDALFQQAQATADDAEQTELYKQMERNLTEHAANVYIQDLADLVVLRNGLEGYQFYPIYVMDLSTVHYAQ